MQELIDYFSKFPGIGPRQAKRFAYYLITRDANYLKKLTDLIHKTKKDISVCEMCFRFFTKMNGLSKICETCADQSRDGSVLMIVGHDVDFESVEKSGSYGGYYFVLGGLLPVLEKEPDRKIRINELVKIVSKKAESGLKEIIIALDVNPEGETTMEYVLKQLESLRDKFGLKISTLGRGLSTGTELEYSDPETIKNALKSRF